MTTLLLAALLAASPEAEAKRQLALVVMTIQSYAEQHHLTKFCLARGSEDPEAPVLEGLRSQHLVPTPASGCVGTGATGMQLTYEVSLPKKGLASVSVEAASLPSREALGHCSYSYAWRSKAWELTDAAICSGY
jgi:hypothetical protein